MDEESLFVKPGSSLGSTWKQQTGKKVGILDGWFTDEFCLERNAGQFESVSLLGVRSQLYTR